MKTILPQINFTEVPRSMSVTYTAALPVRDQTVLFLSGLLQVERARRGTGTRMLSPFNKAVLVLRWFLDASRVWQLATGNQISKSTTYDYLHEGIAVLAARAPALESALLAAKMAGHSHISIDGTLIETDRCRTPGSHHRSGSLVVGQTRQPRREHPGHHRTRRLATVDLRRASRPRPQPTALRAPRTPPCPGTWTAESLPELGDLGYEGVADTITNAIKKPQGGELTEEQKSHN